MKILMSIVAASFALGVSGCNTVAGFGRDVERGGEKIQDASIKVREWRAARERNEGEYAEARRRCDTGTAAERDACRDRARTAYSSRMSESRRMYGRDAMRSTSDEDRREEAYENARDRCNSLRGAEEDRCIDDARNAYLRSRP